MLVDVEDRLDDDGGLGGLAPGADLVGEDGAVVAVDLRELETTGAAGDGCFGEMHVEHHLPRAPCAALPVLGLGGFQRESELPASEAPGGDGAAYVEGVR